MCGGNGDILFNGVIAMFLPHSFINKTFSLICKDSHKNICRNISTFLKMYSPLPKLQRASQLFMFISKYFARLNYHPFSSYKQFTLMNLIVIKFK